MKATAHAGEPVRQGTIPPSSPVSDNLGPATLIARNVVKTYHTGAVDVQALRGVDLALYPREMAVLLGPSGSGKSTLLNIMGGLDTATSGEVLFEDQDLADLGESGLTRYRREHVGFVFQFYNLIPSLTALENVLLVTEIAANPMKAEEALELVGLQERLHHFPAQLSGGEQQRIAIARAIAKRPDILLCDEPTGALDSKTGIIVLQAIEQIHAELNTTTALITHNAVIADIADRVLVFGDGRVVEHRSNDNKRKAAELSW